MVTKERIVAEIKRTADENGGSPLGYRRFAKETGIGDSQWRGRYWRNWGDALTEAGFSRNRAFERKTDEVLITTLIELTRELRRFPSEIDLRMERSSGRDMPDAGRFRKRFGHHEARVAAVREYVAHYPEHADVAALLPVATTSTTSNAEDETALLVSGHVYLVVSHLRSGKRYKIGHTESVPRRHRQIALELPEKPDVVHVIDTDDPVGIEAYWHNRFASKRTNGEWFALTTDDVRAFKRRKFM